MKHKIETIGDLAILTFADEASNHEDGREGSALAMAAYANRQKLSGFDDWLLPTRETLLDLCQIMTGGDEWCWSSSPYAGESSAAWGVDFCAGIVYDGNRKDCCHVRLVRASQLYDIGLAALNKRFGVKKWK